MDVVALITAIRLAIEIAETLSDPEKVKKYRDALAKLEAAAPSIEALESLYASILDQLKADSELRRLKIGQASNPAFAKSKHGITGAAIMLALALGLSSCVASKGAVRELPETAELRAGYGVEWPADASTDPADYRTTQVEGVMQTTVPKKLPE